MYGISKKESLILYSVLNKYKSSINAVLLFGSRARGDYRKNSDVDLAISYVTAAHSDIISEFENSAFPYSVDVINYKTSKNEKLIKNIKRDGRLIFFIKDGKVMITLEQLKSKLEDYSRAVKKLEEAIEKDIAADDMYIDATIKRFEFSFELAWKLLKSTLEYEGIDANSPRTSIREGFKADIIPDAAKWLDMLESRNLSTHTYDEETALDICNAIKSTYISLLVNLKDSIEEKISA